MIGVLIVLHAYIFWEHREHIIATLRLCQTQLEPQIATPRTSLTWQAQRKASRADKVTQRRALNERLASFKHGTHGGPKRNRVTPDESVR